MTIAHPSTSMVIIVNCRHPSLLPDAVTANFSLAIGSIWTGTWEQEHGDMSIAVSANFLHVTIERSMGMGAWGHEHGAWGLERGEGIVRQFISGCLLSKKIIK